MISALLFPLLIDHGSFLSLYIRHGGQYVWYIKTYYRIAIHIESWESQCISYRRLSIVIILYFEVTGNSQPCLLKTALWHNILWLFFLLVTRKFEKLQVGHCTRMLGNDCFIFLPYRLAQTTGQSWSNICVVLSGLCYFYFPGWHFEQNGCAENMGCRGLVALLDIA